MKLLETLHNIGPGKGGEEIYQWNHQEVSSQIVVHQWYTGVDQRGEGVVCSDEVAPLFCCVGKWPLLCLPSREGDNIGRETAREQMQGSRICVPLLLFRGGPRIPHNPSPGLEPPAAATTTNPSWTQHPTQLLPLSWNHWRLTKSRE